MENKIKCGNCGEPNSFYKLNCSSCNAIIRNRVVNIDLWHILWQLVEAPTSAFTKIVQAENKNFVVFLAFLASIKLFLHTFFISSLFNFNSAFGTQAPLNALISLGYFLVFILLFSLIIWKVNKRMEIEGRYKDYYSILIYALFPLVFSLMLLTPVEYALFGGHWFLSNPSPFAIKPMAAYVLSGLEFLILLWSIFLVILGLKLQSNKKSSSILMAVLFFLGIAAIIFLLPYFPF